MTIELKYFRCRWAFGLFCGFVIISILHPLVYFNTFSGDAEIHLVYARNFLNGYPLQFNPGEPSSVGSPGTELEFAL